MDSIEFIDFIYYILYSIIPFGRKNNKKE